MLFSKFENKVNFLIPCWINIFCSKFVISAVMRIVWGKSTISQFLQSALRVFQIRWGYIKIIRNLLLGQNLPFIASMTNRNFVFYIMMCWSNLFWQSVCPHLYLGQKDTKWKFIWCVRDKFGFLNEGVVAGFAVT